MIINKELKKTLFVNKKTYKRMKYSPNMIHVKVHRFKGYTIVKDEWIPKDVLIYVDCDGNVKMEKIKLAIK